MSIFYHVKATLSQVLSFTFLFKIAKNIKKSLANSFNISCERLVLTMEKVKEILKNYEGTSYQIGEQIGTWVLSNPSLLQTVLLPPKTYSEIKLQEIKELLDQYCSGINEEIRGFADTLHIEIEQVLFYAMTYLERGCSLMAISPNKTRDHHTLMARNYDFNHQMEEMCFAYTNVTGKYRHIASTLNLFGRCDGMNEHGLSVCKASIGLPVGNFEGGQKAGKTGFSFWIVVRSILENCRTVREALEWATNASIGYNMNLLLADSTEIALFECIDGHTAYKSVKHFSNDSDSNFLSATNHILLPELKQYETMKIENSVIRNNNIMSFLTNHENISKEELKKLLSTSYPEGLCCHYYADFFGTLRSMIFDIDSKKIEIAFGSPKENKWHSFSVGKLPEKQIEVSLPVEKPTDDFYKIVHE